MRREPIIIALAGGGSGGHLYPLLAVADELARRSGGAVRLAYIAPPGLGVDEFRARKIDVHLILGSKFRRYFSLQNLVDIPKFILGLLQALVVFYAVMPDAVFSKGGPGALPVVLAARFYRIPVMIHESDAVPGLTNRLSAPFAARIGITFPFSARYFPSERTALVGTPVRSGLRAERETSGGAKRALGFDPDVPLVLVLGGSQGAVRLNTFILENLAALLPAFQIYHQTGPANSAEVENSAPTFLDQLPAALHHRYRTAGFLDVGEMRRALAAADVVFSRAGSSTITECALFARPVLLVPLSGSAGDHQRRNAYAYAETGAATVVEEGNLTGHIVREELLRLIAIGQRPADVAAAVQPFVRPAAAEVIAEELLRLAKFPS
ncbi:MAG: UDP-N-acetylglucosamine--N-acetylmuramyl-(pentapeptide) pyrophosphoryl-undecaprenol N-acetylglucosamine transferase [bacterium]|nr:UDP-N-acetylglucosamine--N-acetylmuramyl-(pentapeptide) pyrophosphoryl-undecaprenol N-acetylglucosamine transferase [bacterium]